MLTARELSAAFHGCLRLVKFHVDGFDAFDGSLDGFWRSFLAAALVAPVYVVILALSTEPRGDDLIHYALVQAIAYVITWVAYPLLMERVVRMLDRQHRYFRYFAAYNWFHGLQTLAVILPLSLLGTMLPSALLNPLTLVVLGTLLFYDWFLATRGLLVDGLTGAALVIIDFLLSLVINGVAEQMSK